MFGKIILGVLLFAGTVFSQYNSVRQDSSNIPDNVRHRYGNVISGKGSDDKYHIIYIDEYGNVFQREPIVTTTYTDSCYAATDEDSLLTFTNAVDFVSIWCDETDRAIWIGVDSDTAVYRVAPGAILNMSVDADTFAVRVEDNKATVTASGLKYE